MAHKPPTPPDSPEPIRSPTSATRTHANVSGTDLQKVTDIATETESHNLGKAATLLQAFKGRVNETETKTEKIVLNKQDVEYIIGHMEVSKVVAEKSLREQKGNLYEALVALINS